MSTGAEPFAAEVDEMLQRFRSARDNLRERLTELARQKGWMGN